MNLPEEEGLDFLNAEICHVCEKTFKYSDDNEIDIDHNYDPTDDPAYAPGDTD